MPLVSKRLNALVHVQTGPYQEVVRGPQRDVRIVSHPGSSEQRDGEKADTEDEA
jgi:hypothetical protein